MPQSAPVTLARMEQLVSMKPTVLDVSAHRVGPAISVNCLFKSVIVSHARMEGRVWMATCPTLVCVLQDTMVVIVSWTSMNAGAPHVRMEESVPTE